VVPTTEVRYLINVMDRVWAAERDGSISIRNGKTGEVETSIDTTTVNGEPNFCWCLLLCEGAVWAGFSGGQIRVYNLEAQLLKELHQHAGGVYCLAYSNGYVYSGSNDFECFRWHSRKWEFVRQYSGHRNSVRSILAFATTLISASDDHTILVRDILTGDVQRELTGHRGGVLALLRNGDQLWSGSEDGTIRVWSLQTGEVLHTIADHSGRVTSLCKVDRVVYSTGVDRSIGCYHLQTFKRLVRHQEHVGYINHLAVVGHYTKYFLWSASSDKTLRVWDHDTHFSYATIQSLSAGADDATPLNEALEEKCSELQARLRTALATHESELQQASTNMISLGDTMQRMQKQLDEKEDSLKGLQQQVADAHAAAAEAQAETDRLGRRLEQRDAEVEGLRQEHQAVEERLCQQLQARDADLAECRQRCAAQGEELELLDRERAHLEHTSSGLLRQHEAELERQAAHVLELTADVERRQEEVQEVRGLLARQETSCEELQTKLKACNARIDSNCRSMTDLNLQNEALKAELAQKQVEVQRARQALEGLKKDGAEAGRKAQEWRASLETERQRTALLQQGLGQAEQLAAKWKEQVLEKEKELAEAAARATGLQEALGREQKRTGQLQASLGQSEQVAQKWKEQVAGLDLQLAEAVQKAGGAQAALAREQKRAVHLQTCLTQAEQLAVRLKDQVDGMEDRLRRQEASAEEGKDAALALEQRMRDLEADQLEAEKKESELEFVIQSRSELVRQIWDLFCEISHVKKTYRELVAATPGLRFDLIPRAESCADATAVRDNINAAKDRAKRIVSNYFSEIEKLHVGTSPYFFPPDEDSVKYRIKDSNMDVLKRMGSSDLFRKNSSLLLTSSSGSLRDMRRERSSSAPRQREQTDTGERTDGVYTSPRQPVRRLSNTSAGAAGPPPAYRQGRPPTTTTPRWQ